MSKKIVGTTVGTTMNPDKFAVTVDATLTESGKAADAKVTGERIGELSDQIAQSDWNQNDETLVSFVKNRPFYEETVEDVVLEEQIVEFSMHPSCYRANTVSMTFDLIENENYIVTWDGIFYDVSCKYYEYSNTVGVYYLGNVNYIEPIITSGGDIPFMISVGYGIVEIVTESTETSHTIGIFKKNTIIHPLDEKFIPDSVKANPDWNQNDPNGAGYIANRPFWSDDPVKKVIVEETAIDFTEALEVENPFIAVLIEGRIYNVVWDGTIYECMPYTIQYDDSNTLRYIGNIALMFPDDEGNNMPFLYVMEAGMYMLGVKEYGEHTISITEISREIHHIDSKYIKDMYYEETVVKTILEEQTIEGFEYSEQESMGFANLDFLPKLDLVLGYTYSVEWDGVEYDNLVCFDDYGPTIGGAYGVFNVYPFNIYSINTPEVTYQGIGTSSNASSHTVKIVGQVPENIHKIDSKYLPDDLINEINTISGIAQNAADTAQNAADTAQNALSKNDWKKAGSIRIGSTGLNEVTIPGKFTELRIVGGLNNTNTYQTVIKIKINNKTVSNAPVARASAWNMTSFRLEIFGNYAFCESYGFADGGYIIVPNATAISNLNTESNVIGVELPEGVSIYGNTMDIMYR